MRISTKARYAITAMMQLALNQGKGPVTLSDISEDQGVSLSYLEQLFSRLRKHGLVNGVRGPGGGYHLAVDATELTLAQIIDAVEDRSEEDRKRFFSNHLLGKRGAAADMWHEFSVQLYNFLCETRLGDYVKRYQAGKRTALEPMRGMPMPALAGAMNDGVRQAA